MKSEIPSSKNGPKNPPKRVVLPAGFPASFREGKIQRHEVQWPQYSRDIHVVDNQTTHDVDAVSGWSSREILEEFISSNFAPVKDSKGQETSFELKPTGAIEAFKTMVKEKGHFVSVLRGFGTTNQMRIMLSKIGISFAYPKPVGLISYLLSAFSRPGDIVLDSFAGSGTTAHAVLELNRTSSGPGRRFILVEMNRETMESITAPRIRCVIDGDSSSGIQATGGGFRYLRLAPSLMMRDADEQWVVSPDYNAPMLVEAVCKHEGFRYQPSETVYWQQGRSTEQDFLYVTTQMLTPEHLERLSAEVGPDRHLLVYCAAFACAPDRWPNLTLRKMPNALLDRCEWGRDDYSLKVAALPEATADTPDAPAPSATPDKAATGRGRKKKPDAPEAQPGLFGSPSTEPEESP